MKQLTIYDQPIEHSYHKTVDIPVSEEIEKEKRAKFQDNIVYDILKKHFMLSASETHAIFCKEQNKNVPLTSVRRALSNLKKAGLLVKTEVTKKGIFGDSEHLYKLA